MKPLVTLRAALDDPDLLGGAIPGPSWQTWRILLIAAVGEKLTKAERRIFAEVTGRDVEPGKLVEELWCIVGRRGGKTRAAGTLAAYIGCLCDHSSVLAPGERGVLPILAASTTQASRAFMHVLAVIQHSPVLSQELHGEPTADTIRLNSSVDIEIRPANFKTIRSITAVAAICDEIAFWNIENSNNPDREILNALRPALATTGGPLVVISSPYSKRGELYETYKRDFGTTGDKAILVAKGPSRLFNPSLSQSVVDRAYKRDVAVAASEFGGEFRSDIGAFITREIVEAAVVAGRYELPPMYNCTYAGFVDPSGGSQDSMTLGIAHRDQFSEQLILDCVRERRPPFSPEDVVTEFAQTLRSYGLTTVSGDRYAGEWPRERFSVHGITYELSDRSKSDIFRDLLPLLNSGQIELLENDRTVSQFLGLERRTARGGKDSIDHAPGAHDDLANAVAGALLRASIATCTGPELLFTSVSTDRGR